MNSKALLDCPICESAEVTGILDLACGNFDKSSLYPAVRLNVCGNCGHVYNKLTSGEVDGLMQYYNEEYAPANLSSTEKTGDRPGSNNKNTLARYNHQYNLIEKHISRDSKVLDIGCAMGGFLDYLHGKGFNNLSGIDVTENYVLQAKTKNLYNIKLGDAESIPFPDKSFDLLVMDQVLEHLIEPIKAFEEAKRVLNEGGMFCLGVPDASRYELNYFFDFYWFIMREHIQHFDIEHLKLLAAKTGFELVGFRNSETPIMSDKMILPNLNALFRLTGNAGKLEITGECSSLKDKIKKYVADELKRLEDKKAILNKLSESRIPVYVWGMGREFLYLYESAGLRRCNIAGLIDMNPFKQNNFTMDGRKITGSSILNHATADSVVIITAVAHAVQIENTLKENGYPGTIVQF